MSASGQPGPKSRGALPIAKASHIVLTCTKIAQELLTNWGGIYVSSRTTAAIRAGRKHCALHRRNRSSANATARSTRIAIPADSDNHLGLSRNRPGGFQSTRGEVAEWQNAAHATGKL